MIMIYDAKGSLVLSENKMVERGENNFSINLGGLTAGEYFITMPEVAAFSAPMSFIKIGK